MAKSDDTPVVPEHARALGSTFPGTAGGTPTVLEEASTIVFGDRQDDYGDTARSFLRIARLWSVVLEHEVSAEDVALCLIQLKVARSVNQHHADGAGEGLIKRDSIVDIAGYAQCLALVQSQP